MLKLAEKVNVILGELLLLQGECLELDTELVLQQIMSNI